MKKKAGVAAVLLVIAVALCLFFSAKPPEPSGAAPSSQNTTASRTGISPHSPPAQSNSPGSNLAEPIPSQVQMQTASLAAKAGQRVADSAPAMELGADVVLRNVRRAVHQYGEMFGGNPVGTNPEITSQLTGNNPKHINFINPQPGARVNDMGELVDAWGTPYFFHQISGAEMEIHSAGPDKIMWTSDDLVVK